MFNKSLYIGLMSGTSADGIDAALVHIDTDHIQLLDFITFPSQLKNELITLNHQPQISLTKLAQLHAQVAEEFAQASLQIISQNGFEPAHIQAIGSHGQTLYHAPELGMSLQIGHPAIIAKRTGIQTAADFRPDDMALGGQGAPLAPAFHQQLFDQNNKTHCVINIGGIANISLLRPDQAPLGFDTGPGNCLMDEVCQLHFDEDYDRAGQRAAQADVDPALLRHLLADPYFSQPAPKSTGRETFNQAWLLKHIQQPIEPNQLISTLNQLTVETLAQALESLKLPANSLCTICGGGAYNLTLLNRLQTRLPGLVIQTSQQYNIDPNAIEAMMCAWLAYQRIEHLEINLTQITGAQRPAILGGLWHP